MDIMMASSSIIVGFIGLIWSADKFVLGASTTARNMGVSTLVIGLTIVAFGTSAPEIFSSATAALKGSQELAIGNALGSNIANIGLVLGITCIVVPITIPVTLIKHEIPALLVVTAAVLLVLMDHHLGVFDGLFLLFILAAFIFLLFRRRKKMQKGTMADEEEVAEFVQDITTAQAMAWFGLGLVLLIVSSYVLIEGARFIALSMGVSELAIGLTIVAIGTSLPELAASVASAVKGHHELALGNIIGSNILNMLMVLPVPALMAPTDIPRQILYRDFSVMTIFTVLLSAIIYFLAVKHSSMGRTTGIVFLSMYLAYTVFLFISQ